MISPLSLYYYTEYTQKYQSEKKYGENGEWVLTRRQNGDIVYSYKGKHTFSFSIIYVQRKKENLQLLISAGNT